MIHSVAEIPLNRPTFVGSEADLVRRAIDDNSLSGDGFFTRQCRAKLQTLHLNSRVLMTSSCTHALELSALLLDLKSGDEIIMPSFTFVSTANAFLLRGARLVFADVDERTLNLDPARVEALITERTKAIVLVHYGGIACDMVAFSSLAERFGLDLIEDNAHGLFGSFDGRPLGTFGRFSTLSFHGTKNLTCGEGGALVLNNPSDFERAEIMREKGTNRAQFIRGEVDKYSWVSVGSSYLPSELCMAHLFAQLDQYERIQHRRLELWNAYRDELSGWATASKVRLPFVPDGCEHPAHVFYLLFPHSELRDEAMESLKKVGVRTAFHYVPLHTSPMGHSLGWSAGELPVTESVAARLLRLPLYFNLSDEEHVRVCQAVRELKVI